MKPSEQLYFSRLLRPTKHLFAPGIKVLDAGCGNGVGSEFLRNQGCKVTAIDIQPHNREWKESSALGIKFHTGSIEALPYADDEFDVVWVKDVLHHTENPANGLKELYRVIRPGGTIVVIEANRFNPVFYVHLTLLGEHEHFTRKRFHSLLQNVDKEYQYFMLESRCLPWQASWVLKTLQLFENGVERVKILSPWLTYQIGAITKKAA